MKEAMFYKKNDNLSVTCLLCPHNCKILPNKTGFCLNRTNIDGVLYSLNYGKVSAVNIDPIEKKPLYHYYPDSQIISFGTFGCSLSCTFCQNNNIARTKADSFSKELKPSECIEIAKEQKSKSIAYTYNEPFIWYEHLLESVKIAKENNIKNVLVTNGYYNHSPWEKLAPFIDAMNIDLKGSSSFYKKLCGGDNEPVKKTIKDSYKRGIHIEITNLVITDENDSLQDFQDIVDFIYDIDKNIPLHISRYFPRFKLKNSSTPPETLNNYYNLAKKKLNFVYVGNIIGYGENTDCPNCKKQLIKRTGYNTHVLNSFKSGTCPECKNQIYGRFL